MPEGDTVWRTAQRLGKALAGNEIVLCDLRFPEVATADLRGSRTLEVVSRGKHLLHRFDSGLTLHSHLRMEGQWRVETPVDAARWLRRADLRAAVGTTSWAALGMRLGMVDLVHHPAHVTCIDVDRTGQRGIEDPVGAQAFVVAIEQQADQLAPGVERR